MTSQRAAVRDDISGSVNLYFVAQPTARALINSGLQDLGTVILPKVEIPAGASSSNLLTDFGGSDVIVIAHFP